MCISKVQHMTGQKTVFFGFSIFRQTSQLATKKIQNLCNHNRWSGLLQLGSVRFQSFFPVQQTGPANTTWAFLNAHFRSYTCYNAPSVTSEKNIDALHLTISKLMRIPVVT